MTNLRVQGIDVHAKLKSNRQQVGPRRNVIGLRTTAMGPLTTMYRLFTVIIIFTLPLYELYINSCHPLLYYCAAKMNIFLLAV